MSLPPRSVGRHGHCGHDRECLPDSPDFRTKSRLSRLCFDETGAVTAEYAIVIMAAVAFAGVLLAILRSGEVKQILVDLVHQALSVG